MRNTNILLTNDEIAIVNNLIWEKPVREVAAKIGRSLMALHYYLKHRDNYPPPGKMVGGSGSYSSKEKEKRTSPITVTTTTKAAPAKRPKTEPPMQEYLQKERLAFATVYLNWSEIHWRRVVFHGDRKFNLDGPDGFTHYYHDMRNSECLFSQRPRGGSVFIWFAISYGGPIRCEVSTTKFKSDAFVEFLQSERTSITTKMDGCVDFILQDHMNTFQTYQNWNDVKGIKAQQWPNLSHDVDITENVWGWLVHQVYDGGRRYSRRDDLVSSIRTAWTQLPLHFLQNLYSTLPERMMELYYTNGIYTNC